MFSSESSMTENKPVVMQKVNSNVGIVALLEHTDSFGSDARIKINDFLIKCYSTEVKIVVDAFIEEKKAVVFGKLELENQVKPNLLAFL